MNRRLILTALAAALLPCWAGAQTTAKPAAPKPAPVAPAPTALPSDAVDVVFLGDVRPMLLRLHVQVDGRAFGAAWNDYLYSLFEYLDRDGDLVLSKEEAERAPNPQMLLQQFRGGFFVPNRGTSAVFAAMDVGPVDGKVTLDELAAYYRRGGAGPVQIMPAFGQVAQGNALTDALFAQLDLNKDGKLSKEELLKAADSLRKLDVDDDEMISVQELLPNPFGYPYQFAQGAFQPGNATPGFILHERGSNPRPFVQQLLKKYDTDKNAKLSRVEIGLEKAVFDRLDVNQDGELDDMEIGRFAELTPDAEMLFRLGTPKADEMLAQVFGSSGGSAAARSTGNGAVTLSLNDTEIEVRRAERQNANFGYRQYYEQQFKLADAGKKGYLVDKDVQQPQYQFLSALFPVVDRDGDGKLTEKELLTYSELQSKAMSSSVVLTVADPGRELFAVLDANRDGRLGVRELRSAWARLAHLDRDGDGMIAKTEIPRQFQLTLSQGQPVFNQRFVNVGGGAGFGMGAGPVAAANKGPLWFRKMDRNGDGDVSLKEFLGSREDFKRIDTDGDGLIDLQEAERAYAELKKRPQQAK